ncbi:hypothetical protein GTS_44790 [Gandjariella thermophila]|uniref:Uncharacterized protein n=1 Tax=Gandjariella thermophila TaxID=1931992 RepID=A0A4D4JEQ9_9PSEU|nr:hypothetical protein GTS_44790 [Gandjariella thermophila]
MSRTARQYPHYQTPDAGGWVAQMVASRDLQPPALLDGGPHVGRKVVGAAAWVGGGRNAFDRADRFAT